MKVGIFFVLFFFLLRAALLTSLTNEVFLQLILVDRIEMSQFKSRFLGSSRRLQFYMICLFFGWFSSLFGLDSCIFADY